MKDLSFVFPCLNEAETLASCIRDAHRSLAECDIEYEIIVADNGSRDRSAEIARNEGASVVEVPERGYGAAIRGGICASQGRYVAFADADGSYRIEDLPELYHTAESSGADMVIASRMRGKVEPGAMPFLHRYLGTPVLTAIVNVLFGGRLSDCNSGFRLLRRDAYARWEIRSTGMEFASELIIQALKRQATLVEVPSGLRPDRRSGAPHLRTWRDGMRHLLFIFSERPALFEWTGLALLAASCILQILAFRLGLTDMLGVQIFDYHTQALLIPIGAAGVQLYIFSCSLYAAGRDRPSRLTQRLVSMDEAHLLLLLLMIGAGAAAAFFFVFWRWQQAGFEDLDMIRFVLFMTHFICVASFFAVGLLSIHVLKRQ